MSNLSAIWADFPRSNNKTLSSGRLAMLTGILFDLRLICSIVSISCPPRYNQWSQLLMIVFAQGAEYKASSCDRLCSIILTYISRDLITDMILSKSAIVVPAAKSSRISLTGI